MRKHISARRSDAAVLIGPTISLQSKYLYTVDAKLIQSLVEISKAAHRLLLHLRFSFHRNVSRACVDVSTVSIIVKRTVELWLSPSHLVRPALFATPSSAKIFAIAAKPIDGHEAFLVF